MTAAELSDRMRTFKTLEELESFCGSVVRQYVLSHPEDREWLKYEYISNKNCIINEKKYKNDI